MSEFWHFSEVPPRLAHVGYRGQSGRHVLGVSFSQFDPLQKSRHLAPSRFWQCKADIVLNGSDLLAFLVPVIFGYTVGDGVKPAARDKKQAVADMRTSSAANAGEGKDSEPRQRAAIEAYAKRAGLMVVDWFYDAAVTGASGRRACRCAR